MADNNSDYFATVQYILSQTTESTLRQFQQLTTDEARVGFVASLNYVQKALRVSTPQQQSSKSSDEASRHRQKGNELYKNGKLKPALDCYTVSIINAPVSDSGDAEQQAANNSEYVLALGNRSACLLQTKNYNDCLEDLDLALRYGYPEHLRYKLFDRRARCLIELNRYSEALESLQQLNAVLPLSKLEATQKDAIALNAEKKMNFCTSAMVQQPSPATSQTSSQTSTDSQQNTAELPPSVSGKKSERFPGASEVFDVRFHQDRGRYGVASKDITVGDVILVETPYVSVLSADMYKVRCYHCFKTIRIAYGCHRCTTVRYCSEACRKQSWELHHSIECPYLGLLSSSNTGTLAHLTLKVLLVTGLQRVLKYKRNPKSDGQAAQQSLFTNSSGVYLGGYMAVYTLLSHTASRNATDFLQYTLLAVWLTNILYRSGFVQAAPSESGEDSRLFSLVGGIVLRFVQIIACNGLEVTELRLSDTLPKSQPGCIGLALYPTISLLNHSCDPLLELVFHRNVCAVRAIQNISAGQELDIDYGYVYYTTPAKQRQTALKAQYFFDCQCQACVLGWELKSTLKTGVPVLICTDCAAPLPAASDPAATVECARCGGVQSAPKERLEALHASQTKAEEALKEAKRFHVDKATAALERHITLVGKYIQLPWKDYVVCVSNLKQCYRLYGNHVR